MPLTQLVLDNWSPLDYKTRFSERRVFQAPTWVGDIERRRLEAYKLLRSYIDNQARAYLDTDDDTKRSLRREYGDPQLIVETIVDAILGDDATISVEGAGDEDEPDELADSVQDWFDQWDLDERPLMAIIEGEADAVGLGDAVYEIALDTVAGRPTVTVWDPGFYFPVLDDELTPTQFPTTVHLAWEFERETEKDHKEMFVRRITYQLVTLVDEAGNELQRMLPWNADASSITCLKSDGTWPVRSMDRRTVLDLTPQAATWATNAEGEEVHDLDLGIDFIPVIHEPNTVARKEHFGRSSLMYILQILDEIQSADTDLALTARTTGFPAISIDGSLPVGTDGKTITSYGPGTVLGGKATLLDTSTSLDALLKYVEALLTRLDTNARLSAAVTGRKGAQEFSSGIHMAIASGPLKSMVRKMRLTRSEKYPLMWKFVARFAMLLEDGGLGPNPDLPRIELTFGSFMPSDRAAEILEVKELFAAKLLSRLTAIRRLIELGLDIDDAEEEVTRIEHEDFEGANSLVQAVGDEAAADYLGREVEERPVEPPPAPEPDLPEPPEPPGA
jgi:hypothetical protein